MSITLLLLHREMEVGTGQSLGISGPGGLKQSEQTTQGPIQIMWEEGSPLVLTRVLWKGG